MKDNKTIFRNFDISKPIRIFLSSLFFAGGTPVGIHSEDPDEIPLDMTAESPHIPQETHIREKINLVSYAITTSTDTSSIFDLPLGTDS